MPDSDARTGRQPKKRATLACEQCRYRKVKCDMVQMGSPCQNCQSGGIECKSTLSKRSRQYRLQKIQSMQNSLPRPLLLPQRQPQLNSPGKITSISNETSGALSSEQDRANSRISHVPQDGVLAGFTSTSSPPPNPSLILDYSSTTPGLSDRLELPSYIRVSSHTLESEDLDYLKRRGALSIPSPKLRDELILAFVLYVYPFLPVINLQDFLDALDGRPGCEVSLILFQAIMFSGTAFVDKQFLLEAGFEDRLAARAFFFRKIKARVSYI